eukprot:16558_3
MARGSGCGVVVQHCHDFNFISAHSSPHTHLINEKHGIWHSGIHQRALFLLPLRSPLTHARPLPPPSSALSRPHPPAAPADGIGDGRNNAGTGASKNSANAPVAYPTESRRVIVGFG